MDEDDAADTEISVRLADSRPQIDDIARSVIRKRAAEALFGPRDAEVIRVGRYALSRAIGIGGGGAVYSGHDPELDRPVAVKLIATATPALRTRALGEGKALAKLAHPNVVGVFDVGESGDRVYLVMELVRGTSLREHVRTARSVRQVVALCRQAGEGLAAAHAAGLVHRDFKLDNAVVGEDGRVRVIDFGLAVTTGLDGEEARIAGTPAYMAPEQQRGEPLTAATDQYAFGASVREAVLAKQPSVPRWLVPVIARATAEAAADRYASMTELLRALGRDPVTRLTRATLITAPFAVVAMGVAGFALGRGASAPACDAEAVLGDAWSAERGERIERHLRDLATPLALATAARGRSLLDATATRWREGYASACAAAADGLGERRVMCLMRVRSALAASAHVLETADAAAVPAAARALAELPDPAGCAEAGTLDTPPPADRAVAVAGVAELLERARVGVEAATPASLREVTGLVAAARSLGFRPLIADALLVGGRIAMALDDYPHALASLAEASSIATAAGADAIAVEAFARVMWLRSVTGTDPRDALGGFELIAAMAERLGPRDRFARALLSNNAGVVENAAGHRDAARAHWTTALALAKLIRGPGEVELGVVRANLARVTDDPAERARLHAEAIALARDRLGDEHPLTFDAQIYAAFSEENPIAALNALRPICPRYAALYPAYAATIEACASELGWLELAFGTEEAAAAMFRESAARAPGPDGAVSRAYVRLLAGDPARALAMFEAARPVAATQWWELRNAAKAELGVVLAARRLRDPRARDALSRAIDALTRALAMQPHEGLVARPLAWALRLKE